MSDRPEDLLDSAVAMSIQRGIPASGWMVERDSEGGYSAWLYVDVKLPQGIYNKPLHSRGEVSICSSLLDAALSCLRLAGGLGVDIDPDAEDA